MSLCCGGGRTFKPAVIDPKLKIPGVPDSAYTVPQAPADKKDAK